MIKKRTIPYTRITPKNCLETSKMRRRPYNWVYRSKHLAPRALRLVHGYLNSGLTQQADDDQLGCPAQTVNTFVNHKPLKPGNSRNLAIALNCSDMKPVYIKDDVVLSTRSEVNKYLANNRPVEWAPAQIARAILGIQVITPYLMSKLGFTTEWLTHNQPVQATA